MARLLSLYALEITRFEENKSATTLTPMYKQHPLSLGPCWDGQQPGSGLFPGWHQPAERQSLWRQCRKEYWFCTSGQQLSGWECSSPCQFRPLPSPLPEAQENSKHIGNMRHSGFMWLNLHKVQLIKCEFILCYTELKPSLALGLLPNDKIWVVLTHNRQKMKACQKMSNTDI